MPMIDFSVVVLPAPLRPSSVTTSPALTSKVTPCRMWDSPYQACRSFTASSARSGADSFTARPHIGFAHFRVGRNSRVVAFRQHAPARQHGDAVGDAGDDAEIVLHHQHGAVRRDALDQRCDAVDILVPH